MANLEVNGVFPSYPEWEALYHSVLLESDYAKVPTKIFDAETAMFKRKLQLRHGCKESRCTCRNGSYQRRTLTARRSAQRSSALSHHDEARVTSTALDAAFVCILAEQLPLLRHI
jgi:hypothetical protein